MAEEFRRALAARLAERGAVWPAAVEHLERVDSTNALLLRRARRGAPDWSLVIADEQTAGRGRRGRRWRSPRGGLYLSLLLRDAARRIPPTLVPLAAGVAVAGALSGLGAAVRLKWPNDVLAGDGKLAGILVEGIAGAGGLEAVVLGIGVNLEPSAEDATSLASILVRPVAREEVAAAILAELRSALGAAERRALVAAWREWSVAWWGSRVSVEAGGERVEGVARDVDEDGALVLELDDGRRRAVLSGEATLLRPLEPGA